MSIDPRRRGHAAAAAVKHGLTTAIIGKTTAKAASRHTHHRAPANAGSYLGHRGSSNRPRRITKPAGRMATVRCLAPCYNQARHQTWGQLNASARACRTLGQRDMRLHHGNSGQAAR